jgi:hypothetical protein
VKSSRVLDIAIHGGIIAIAALGLKFDADGLGQALLVPAVFIVALLPFRGRRTHAIASGVDVLAR